MFTTTKFHKFELHMEQLNSLAIGMAPVQRKVSVQAQLDMWTEKIVTGYYVHFPLLNCSELNGTTEWIARLLFVWSKDSFRSFIDFDKNEVSGDAFGMQIAGLVWII